MKEIKEQKFMGERALFSAQSLILQNCIFKDGESPLKHSEQIRVTNSHFAYKYPFWYSKNIDVKDCTFSQMARAGIWYSSNLRFTDVLFEAPKAFRKSSQILLENITFTDAAETLWNCTDIRAKNISAKGDYFAMNCENVEFIGLNLVGNYSFDGCKNVHIKDSKLLSKDAFWNCENVVVENCVIIGEYLGWNSKNITLINCTVESLQGMCYIQNLVMRECMCADTTLAFEYSTVDVEILGKIHSVKNPLCGRIKAKEITEVIMDEDLVDPSKTEIITN
ncbi:DUF3737 family protein [Campylobacter sp. RM9344]|uniref:DUF3737 family protein n=1 Tax=Campylobacter californiensis TaxID=1032243 RepID=A0AAW3ZYB2_9BACT|nr:MULTISPECIES: DUF3737 family protein [unclassified Campylobacter]MBE2984963.1 DUF3737 family protein [Campylobacter sp. RM6883]MBE2986690.1 DUF3737 family protein [Campylobacter sp. RM12919]MBE2988777.1 DUF3737 family protein [Campylobacter sp. RM12920]MBE2995405.1 DUF3737 family protein [Campylobacter sp. RM6913]MBE3029976.1 DUF3737 family protein [Campylobacter sp. RM9344]